MRQNDIGKILFTLRKHYNISQEMLCRGICSDATLSRIELGERIPDKFLLDALLQRLGKSPDKLETILSERDYYLYEKRQSIEKAIFEHNFEEAKKELFAYEKLKECEEKLHQQYIYKIKAVLADEIEHDVHKNIDYLLKAINLTLPSFEIETILEYLLSIEEIYLLLMLAQAYSNTDQEEQALQLLHKIIEYLDEKYTDEEEKVKVYPKAVYLLSKLLLENEKYDELVYVCLKTIDLIVTNGVINCLSELLQLCIIGLRHQNNKDLLHRITCQYESLNELYKEYNFATSNQSSTLLLENTQSEIYLVNEFIKKCRITNGLSQESLSGDICSPETLSRIESGKRAPSIKNFESLTTRMGINKDLYNSFISSENFEVFEKKREITKLASLHKYVEAEKIFNELVREINDNVPENKQFLLHYRTFLDYRNGKINSDQALAGYEQALRYTMKNFGKTSIKNHYISREEAFLINRVAIIYKNLGYKEKSIQLLKEVLENYENSKIDEKYHSVTTLMIMANLSTYLEENGNPEEGEIICDKGIRLSLRCARGNMLAVFLTEKFCCLEKIDNINKDEQNKKARIKYLKQAFYISDLMKDHKFKDAIQKYYYRNYKKDLI